MWFLFQFSLFASDHFLKLEDLPLRSDQSRPVPLLREIVSVYQAFDGRHFDLCKHQAILFFSLDDFFLFLFILLEYNCSAMLH